MKELEEMDVMADKEGYISYHEMLFKVMRRRFSVNRPKRMVIRDLERETHEKIMKIYGQGKDIKEVKRMA